MSEIRDEMKKLDAPIDWSNPDYTGASAEQYVDKYANRPEDAGTLEGLQNILGVVGMIPGAGEPADWVNALLYGSQGDAINAALYGSGVGMMGNFIGKNKEGVKHIIKRLDDLGFDKASDVTKAVEEFKGLPDFKDRIKASGRPFIDEFSSWYKGTLTSIQRKVLDLKNNPNVGGNIGMFQNQDKLKKYRK
tara:strand:- start:4677 stop:5249 length:573 start_codon:yes stop_codon:yes gene_type:complete